MAQYCGIIMSESVPGFDNRYVWFKPSTDEWFEIQDGSWIKVSDGSEIANLKSATIDVSGKAEFKGGLEVGGEPGITTDIVIGTTTIKVKDGIIYEVEEA